MPADYLHNHPEFTELIRIVAAKKRIDPALVEKDYWIMHCLYGLQKLGMKFELKGGTSLSKGFRVIDRFSEDIDIRIEPRDDQDVKVGKGHTKPAHIESRRKFYQWVADNIRIDGIVQVERDTQFDNSDLFSAGIRLRYKTHVPTMNGLKDGVLLELGFDEVTPNEAKDISSWLYDHARPLIEIIDNRAKAVACYDARYTFVEKLQTISTKFRKQQQDGEFPINFMRHYYDVYQLLQRADVQKFIGTDAYQEHKKKRFRTGDDPELTRNEAFNLNDPATRARYAKAFNESAALYYGTKPSFEEILNTIRQWTKKL